MRNITVFLVLVTILASVHAENPYALSLSYQSGFLYGQAEEIVYPSDTVAPLLSLLSWDMKPVWYNGFKIDFAQLQPAEKWGGFANLSLKYGVPGSSGVMENRDWMSTENDELTHFSSHDNITRALFFADVEAGVSFPMQSVLLFKTYARVSYMSFHFSGLDGQGIYARLLGNSIYASIDDNPTTMPFEGKVINYAQQWLIAALGISFTLFLHPRFSAELFFMTSPFVACSALDEHLTRSIQFRDNMLGGTALEMGAMFAFSVNKWVSLALECSWRNISGTRGESYSRRYGTGFYAQNGEAGSGLSLVDTGLCVKVRL